MQVFCAHMGHIFPEHGQQFETTVEPQAIGHVVVADAADVFCETHTTPIADREPSNHRGGNPLYGFASWPRDPAHPCYGMTPTAVSASCIRLPSGTASRRFRNPQNPFRLAPSDVLYKNASGRQVLWWGVFVRS